jgi:outer membrane protein assembly factor BamB
VRRIHSMPVAVIWFLAFVAAAPAAGAAADESAHNFYKPGSFPAKFSERVFEIPLDPADLIAVIPASHAAEIPALDARFKERSGVSIPWRTADAVQAEDLRGKNLILAGNITDNPWILEMYMKRLTYADAYFPGKGGYHIHPAKSVWDRSKNVMVVGAGDEGGLGPALEAFLSALTPGVKSIGPVRLLKTSHTLPAVPPGIEPALGPTIKDLRERPPYRTVAEWGFMYFFTGDKKWAELYRDGMTVLHRRAETSGKWITEPWSNIYFVLWNLFHVWQLIDDDPFFEMKDRQIIDEVLYGYTMYIQDRPYLDKDLMPPAEPRQNHYTFLALSLDAAYRYYTEKYAVKGLESMADKVRRTFDDGQGLSYRPNDDGGSGYQVLAPSHYLYYALPRGDLSFIESGRLRTQVDLIAATTDNRGDPVTFGDIGNYAHRQPGSLQMEEVLFPSVAAWFYKDGAYQWLCNWLGRDSVINLSPWSPVGMGFYAGGLAEAPPSRFTGILPVVLDEASLRWSSRRSANPGELPLAGVKYFDKISFRKSFAPEDEYLLLDGTSTWAHGHQDGNTVTRLTWKDRVWLADLDYIKDGPQEHNGVSVVRNGTQDAPPPLNRLDLAADFEALGATETTATGFNGADWGRRILWKKGRYFLFLDSVVAREPGAYRLENRWRLRGDVSLQGNTVTVRQGNPSFFIRSADGAARELGIVPDSVYYSHWDYPFGHFSAHLPDGMKLLSREPGGLNEPGATTVCLAAKDIRLPQGSRWVFANLMYATDSGAAANIELRRAAGDLYVVDDAGRSEVIGLDPGVLGKSGISTDCGMFALTGDRLYLFGLGRLTVGRASIISDVRSSLEIDLASRTGVMLVPEEGGFVLRGVEVENAAVKIGPGGLDGRLKPGKYAVKFPAGPAIAPVLDGVLVEAAGLVLPGDHRTKPVDFGLEPVNRTASAAEISAAAADGGGLLFGTAAGSVHALEGGKERLLFTLPEGKRVLAIAGADLNGDGRREIISSDSGSRLFCHDADGALLWTSPTVPFFGPDADVTEIVVDDIDGRGVPTILAATNGWKLYAFRPDGKVRWESFIFYHRLTRVRVLKDKGRTVIAVGTNYQTPLNVVDPATGVVIWKTWEQTGSETMSTTEYCGKVLRDMVFVDTDGDGAKEIVFGNDSHTVTAMNAADGRVKWRAQVGDKVSVMKLLGERAAAGAGGRILAATEAGEVYIFDKSGRREAMMSLGSGVTGLEVMSFGTQARDDVLFATGDGRLAVYDADFVPRGSLEAGIGRLNGVFPAKSGDKDRSFYAVGGRGIVEVRYRPYYLYPSRHY